METCVITYNDLGGNNNLFGGYENIQGKTAKEAIEKRFEKKFKRLTGEQGRYANIIVLKGTYNKDRNEIQYKGKYTSLCFGIA